AVAIALENTVSAPLVVIAPQELGDFEFDGFLEHELSAQADAFGQWRLPSGRAKELFFEGLAGELAFHVCLLRISAKSDTHFGKYSDSRFGLNSDTFRSGATLRQNL